MASQPKFIIPKQLQLLQDLSTFLKRTKKLLLPYAPNDNEDIIDEFFMTWEAEDVCFENLNTVKERVQYMQDRYMSEVVNGDTKMESDDMRGKIFELSKLVWGDVMVVDWKSDMECFPVHKDVYILFELKNFPEKNKYNGGGGVNVDVDHGIIKEFYDQWADKSVVFNSLYLLKRRIQVIRGNYLKNKNNIKTTTKTGDERNVG